MQTRITPNTDTFHAVCCFRQIINVGLIVILIIWISVYLFDKKLCCSVLQHLHAAGLNQLNLPVFSLYLRVISDELLDHALQRLTKVK